MTRADIKTLLQAAGYATDTDTAQNAAIDAAFREVAGSRNWGWLQATATPTLTVGSNVLTALPTDLAMPTEVRIEFGTDFIEPLKFLDYDELNDKIHKYRENDVPVQWSWYNNTIYIWPRPDKAYTVTLDYYSIPVGPTGDSWVPPFDSDFHQILAWGALRWLSFRERDWWAHMTADQEYRQLLREMESADARGSESAVVGKWAGWQRVK